jgi:hypothetical protein
MMVKLALVAAFVMTMATLTFAASALPSPEAEMIAPKTTVASVALVKTASYKARQIAMPEGVVPAAAVELMASL